MPLGGPAMTFDGPCTNRSRTIGAWCFVDHYGEPPDNQRCRRIRTSALQTVSWLISGDVEHRTTVWARINASRPG